jgi:hypothetical protein
MASLALYRPIRLNEIHQLINLRECQSGDGIGSAQKKLKFEYKLSRG